MPVCSGLQTILSPGGPVHWYRRRTRVPDRLNRARPQYFWCMVAANRDFVRHHSVAVNRAAVP
jgi:hypothetical protein